MITVLQKRIYIIFIW